MDTLRYVATRKETILDLRRWGLWRLTEAAAQEAGAHGCDAWECYSADERLLGSGVDAG